MANHIYVADHAKGFRTRLTIGKDDSAEDVLIQFEDGQYKTDNDEIAEQLDLAITKGKLARFCRKVDRAAAEQLAAEFMARKQRSGGVKGQISALSAQKAMTNEIAQRDAVLSQPEVDVQEIAESNDMELTEPVAETRVQTVEKATLETTSGIKLGS